MGFTTEDVRALLEAFEAGTWEEMTVEIGGDRVHVSRRAGSSEPPARAAAAAPVAAAASASPPAPAVAESAPPDPVPVSRLPAADEAGTPVVSPSVGLFWRAPAPDAPPFVEVGTRVGPHDTVGIVEVMKLMSPVAAGVAGTVTAVLVDNGAMVEHGQSLVLIQP